MASNIRLRGSLRTGLRLLGAAALAFVALTPVGVDAQGQSTPVAIEAIASNPDRFLGQTVTVKGSVDDILSARTFVLDNNEFFGEDILVVNRGQMRGADWHDRSAWRYSEGDELLVTGTVRRFDLRQWEQDLGVDLNDRAYEGWNGRVAILATSVQPSVLLSEITSDPRSFLGRRVTVRGNVEEMRSPQSFVLDASGWFSGDILVVNATGQAVGNPHWGGSWRGDNQVQVTGRVRMFRIADFEREYGVDLDNNLYVDWEGKPAIFARSVQVVMGG